MAKRALKAFEVRPIVELVHAALREGARPPQQIGQGASAVEVARQKAVEAGLATKGVELSVYLEAAKAFGMEVDWSLYRPPQYQKPAEVAKVFPVHEAGKHSKPTGRRVRVCVIPDIHVAPDIPNDRLLWIGRWCADMAPDYIVQLGDFLTLDSMSTHAKPGTITHSRAPTFEHDLDAGRKAMELFNRGAGNPGACPRIICYGNHEFRAHRFEENTPNVEGSIVGSMDELFAELGGFRIIPYGEFVFIEGVGFIHHVNNTIGRPYGGKTSAQRIASDSVFSVVHGHTHSKQSADVPKIGPNNAVRAISAGCALPHGHIEHYARHSTTGWWMGVLCLTIQDGQILDEHWTSMLTLEANYG